MKRILDLLHKSGVAFLAVSTVYVLASAASLLPGAAVWNKEKLAIDQAKARDLQKTTSDHHAR